MKSEALRQRVETWLLAVWFGYPRGWQKRIYRLAWPILNQLSKLVDREARRRALKVERLPGSARPAVIVVGNLVVGGSGKTPMVIALARLLTAQGLKVGLLARGYRARGNRVPRLIDARTSPDEAGDEALLLAQTGLPVAVGSRRREALELLCSTHTGLDVVISDDGLQHAALPDGTGQRPLPAGRSAARTHRAPEHRGRPAAARGTDAGRPRRSEGTGSTGQR